MNATPTFKNPFLLIAVCVSKDDNLPNTVHKAQTESRIKSILGTEVRM